MNQTFSPPPQPPRLEHASVMDQVIANTKQQKFDPDAWHVMNARDNALIEQELMNGAGSRKFIYSFPGSDGQIVTGVSVIGARHLAAEYKGIKHRLLASATKNKKMMTFQTYPQPGIPMSMYCSSIPEIADDPDFYTVLIEISDLMTGNTLQVEVSEFRYGQKSQKSGGGTYERAHYKTIAQSKAFRNGVLDIIPQDVVLRWKDKMLKLPENNEIITVDLLQEKREAVMRYAAAKGIPIERQALETLLLPQIAGLSDAAHADKLDGFKDAAVALAIVRGAGARPWDRVWSASAPAAAGSAAQAQQPSSAAAPGPATPNTAEQPAQRAADDKPPAYVLQEGGGAALDPRMQPPPNPDQTFRLISPFGEILIDGVGLLEWAKEFSDHFKHVSQDQLRAYEDHNWDTVMAALDDPDSARIMAKAGPGYATSEQGAPESQPQQEQPAAAPATPAAAPAAPSAAPQWDFQIETFVPPEGRGADSEFAPALRRALEKVGDPGDTPGSSLERNIAAINAWKAVNLPILNALETRRKVLGYKELAARCRALEIPTS